MSPTVIRPGTLIAERYRLLRPLQSGGMSVVWEAEVDGAVVALKLLHASLVGTDAEERMLREARVLAQLDHPAAARVLDVGATPDGVVFLALELLRGRTLLELIDERWRIEPAMAVRMLLPIAGALAAAHAQGIVHRDVKPSNIILIDTEPVAQAKLIDFGLALVASAQGRITQSGTLVGTPAYIAPELTRQNATVDLRCDIWSLSVVLYHAITGRVPFSASSAVGLLDAINELEPTPSHDLHAGDAALWGVLKRGLAKDLAARWASMDELSSALVAWLDSSR